MVSRLCDDGVQGRDGRCVENSSCFQIFLFVPVCILLLGSPAGLIHSFIHSFAVLSPTAGGADDAGGARANCRDSLEGLPGEELVSWSSSNKKLLGARTLLGAPGLTTRSKDATRGSWHRY